MQNYSMKQIQSKILEVMIYVDKLCRDNDIEYYIMGGTALGAVRHKGFIPWDDDLDIFMTPGNYEKFKSAFSTKNDSRFEIQEWRLGNNPLEPVLIVSLRIIQSMMASSAFGALESRPGNHFSHLQHIL